VKPPAASDPRGSALSAPGDRRGWRRPQGKAACDAATRRDIPGAMPVAHGGHPVDGVPVVTPTLRWRIGERLCRQGPAAGRVPRRAAAVPRPAGRAGALPAVAQPAPQWASAVSPKRR
jgi:hypothetical protein